jgi:uncharacterized protein (TIGR02217 family)
VLVAFFEARRGRLHSFRFRDFTDFRSCAPSASISPLDQRLGAGTGAAVSFQLLKLYGDVERPIRKPVDGSVRIAVDGVETGAFALDPPTGVVTLVEAPPEGAVVTAGFAFDTPVRFDTDRIDVTLEGFEAGRLVAAPLIEIRV